MEQCVDGSSLRFSTAHGRFSLSPITIATKRKKKLIEIYQPQPTEMAFFTGTEENLSPERAARLVKEAKNVNVSCNLHLRVCLLMKSAVNGKMLLLQRPNGLMYCYDTRCMISNLDDLRVVLRPICR